MKTRITLISVALLALTSSASAETKVITLKDGSRIVGEVVGMSEGAYTVKTTDLGEIKIDDEKILNIQAQGAAQQEMDITSSSLKGQVAAVQGEILSDPAIMKSITDLAQDEEIQKILQNPELMNTIKTFDAQTIKNDPAIQQLLENEEVQQTMKQIMLKMQEE